MLRSIQRQLITGHASKLSSLAIRCFSVSADFEAAQKNLKKLSEEPDVQTKLKMYSLFKQATQGDVTGSRPGMMDFAGRAKYDAWKSVQGTPKDKAQHLYIELVNSLLKEDEKVAASSQSSIEGLGGVNGLSISVEGNIFRIRLNRPEKFNALTWDMYRGLTEALNFASKDKKTRLTVISAAGNYYCSGNDLSNFAVKTPEDVKEIAKAGEKVLNAYVKAYVEHDKPLIGLINGPAIGISVTVLGLFDSVIASDKATFHTPFTSLGQSAEGCSSLTFPLLMGHSKAAEVLLFGKKLTANEAFDRGLVTEVIPDKSFAVEAEKRVAAYSELPPESLRLNKILLRDINREALHKANNLECKLLHDRWQSAECAAALQKFMTRKNK
uniref:ACB domain-containing protein n=1 Tax=Steinernema glaseri TaxID=37863 RepID=A0A1I7Y4T4_9BILA